MTVTPSCTALLVHEDDAFRKALIAALDGKHFAVTFTASGTEAVQAMREKTFKVIVLSADASEPIEYLREHRRDGVILLAMPNPGLRNDSKLAEETLLKPVDPDYVADRARVYCRH